MAARQADTGEILNHYQSTRPKPSLDQNMFWATIRLKPVSRAHYLHSELQTN